MTPEGWVKKDIRDWLTQIGAYYVMPVKERYGRVGVPDFIICICGYFIAVEAKRPGNEGGSTERQKDEAAAVRIAGGIALVITDVEQLKDFCYAHQSIGAQLPTRSSPRKPRATRAAKDAPARKIRVREKTWRPAD